MNRILMLLVGAAVLLWSATGPARTRAVAKHDQRGLSQSTENALLVGGAVVIATLVVVAVKTFVQARLP